MRCRYFSDDEIPATDLVMVEIELDAQVRPVRFAQDVGRLLQRSEEIPRPVAPVDRLDQQGDAPIGRAIGAARKIANKGALRLRLLMGGRNAGQAMDLAA